MCKNSTLFGWPFTSKYSDTVGNSTYYLDRNSANGNPLYYCLWIQLCILILNPQAHVYFGTVTGKSKLFATQLAKCLDQGFQTTLSALDDKTFKNLVNLSKGIITLKICNN